VKKITNKERRYRAWLKRQSLIDDQIGEAASLLAKALEKANKFRKKGFK